MGNSSPRGEMEHGAVVRHYGRFCVRECLPPPEIRHVVPVWLRWSHFDIFLLLAPDEKGTLEGSADELLIGSVPSFALDLPWFLCHLVLVQHRDQEVIGNSQQAIAEYETPSGRAELERNLEDVRQAGDEGDLVAEYLDHEYDRLNFIQTRALMMKPALDDLMQAHSELDINTLMPLYQEKLKPAF